MSVHGQCSAYACIQMSLSLTVAVDYLDRASLAISLHPPPLGIEWRKVEPVRFLVCTDGKQSYLFFHFLFILRKILTKKIKPVFFPVRSYL